MRPRERGQPRKGGRSHSASLGGNGEIRSSRYGRKMRDDSRELLRSDEDQGAR